MSKERPILFSGAMVLAIFNGTKTQTRRIVKHQPPFGCSYTINGAYSHALCFQSEYLPDSAEAVWVPPTPKTIDHRLPCPYGTIGDKLWVRETFSPQVGAFGNGTDREAFYRATHPDLPTGHKWKPSIFMPRWASRITLEITGVRVERLNDISDADAKAEGVTILPSAHIAASVVGGTVTAAQFEYYALWESINGSGSWAKNPWCWVIEFTPL